MKGKNLLNLIVQYSFFNTVFVLLEPTVQDQGGTRSLPKWQIVGSAASKPLQRPVASLKPGSAPQKATLLTQNGPVDVSTDLSYLPQHNGVKAFIPVAVTNITHIRLQRIGHLLCSEGCTYELQTS